MKQRRAGPRTMCAELLTIRWTDRMGKDRSAVVSLEDISEAGACLRSEYAILPETAVSLHYSSGKYQGAVRYCTYETSGFLIGVAFDDGYRWSKADFEPSHLLEVPSSGE